MKERHIIELKTEGKHGRNSKSLQRPLSSLDHCLFIRTRKSTAIYSTKEQFATGKVGEGHVTMKYVLDTIRHWTPNIHDFLQTYYTKEAFSDSPKKLLSDTSRCQFAHSSVEFKHSAPEDLIYCVAYDASSSSGHHSLSSSRLFSSTDFFESDRKVEDLGIGKNAKGVIAFAIVSKFAVVALKDLSPSNTGEMLLFVSVDAVTWAQAQFPHASSAKLRENAYTIVESTTHSLAVDVMLQDRSSIGTLFVSNSNGTFFVESLKDTNRNDYGFVDYERIYGVEGIGLANIVANAQAVEGRGARKQLKSLITFDDGKFAFRYCIYCANCVSLSYRKHLVAHSAPFDRQRWPPYSL